MNINPETPKERIERRIRAAQRIRQQGVEFGSFLIAMGILGMIFLLWDWVDGKTIGLVRLLIIGAVMLCAWNYRSGVKRYDRLIQRCRFDLQLDKPLNPRSYQEDDDA